MFYFLKAKLSPLVLYKSNFQQLSGGNGDGLPKSITSFKYWTIDMIMVKNPDEEAFGTQHGKSHSASPF